MSINKYNKILYLIKKTSGERDSQKSNMFFMEYTIKKHIEIVKTQSQVKGVSGEFTPT